MIQAIKNLWQSIKQDLEKTERELKMIDQREAQLRDEKIVNGEWTEDDEKKYWLAWQARHGLINNILDTD